MNFELEEYHRNTSNEELITDLKRVANDLGKSQTINEYNERGTYHATTISRRFGSWVKALQHAGLGRTRSPLNIPEEDLFQNLEKVWTKLGRQPRYNEIQKPLSEYSAGTYEKRFGSWRKALGKFVAYVNDEESYSPGRTVVKVDSEVFTKHKTKRAINWRLRFVVTRRDNFKCKKCGRSPATEPTIILQVDHKIAWTNGGETVLENLETLCLKCNVGKSDLE